MTHTSKTEKQLRKEGDEQIEGAQNMWQEMAPRSYPEHEKYENGNYMNTCCSCKRTFTGMKHCYICKECKSDE